MGSRGFAVAAWLAALVLPVYAQQATSWPDTYVGRLEALALIQTLNAEILASRSATSSLESWCRDRLDVKDARIVAEVVAGVVKAPTPEQRQRLEVNDRDSVKYRRVRLHCGDHVLSEADNWYVPGRLTPEMNRLLETTTTPFGTVVRPLEPYRRTFAVTLLWAPLPDGWERGSGNTASERHGTLTIPDAVFEHRAVLYDRDHRPFSEVSEVYRGEILAVPRRAQVQDLPGVTESHGGFGLPDPSGARLLVMPWQDRNNPELLKTALCTGGVRVAVQFDRRQTDSANDGRARSSNFEKLAGSVFTVLGNRIEPDAPCFLASEALLAGSTVLDVAGPEGPGACLRPERFATLRDRRVVHCWPIARLAAGKDVVLLEFERREKDALASLVLVDGARTIFADFTAEFRGVGESLWRVDDGGVLSPEGFTVVCALQRGSWYALGTAWAGAEGRSLSLWISDGNGRFTKVVNDYWYQAPQ